MSYASITQRIYNLLSNDAYLAGMITGVFDVVPSDQESPYIVMGQLQALEGRLLDHSARSWSLDLHIWSSYRGRLEVVQIADLIMPIVPSDWWFEELIVLDDESGWYHGVLTLRGYDR